VEVACAAAEVRHCVCILEPFFGLLLRGPRGAVRWSAINQAHYRFVSQKMAAFRSKDSKFENSPGGVLKKKTAFRSHHLKRQTTRKSLTSLHQNQRRSINLPALPYSCSNLFINNRKTVLFTRCGRSSRVVARSGRWCSSHRVTVANRDGVARVG
jgi:hypothetical protein